MGKFDSLTKFIPVLDMSGLARWCAEEGCEPYVEYWDVVDRFAERLAEYVSDNPGCTDGGGEASSALCALIGAVDHEEELPGVLLGYLENGTIVALLKQLRAADADG